jgi:ribosomal protein S18 acetylase RimI-like enzyme
MVSPALMRTVEEFDKLLIRPPRAGDGSALLAFDASARADEHLQGLDSEAPLLTLEEKERWLRESMEHSDCFTLVVEQSGKIVGLLESRVRELPRSNSHVLRFYVSVSAGYRRRGIGSELLKRMIEWAREQEQIRKISLGVLSTNGPAISLYQHLGFVEDGRKKMEYQLPDGSFADEISMALFLGRKS